GLFVLAGLGCAVSAISLSDLPILTGLVIGSSTGPEIGSSLSLSSSTHIVTSATPSTGTSSGNSAGQQSVSSDPIIPEQWQPGVREGIYYDPLSKTSWVYDRILKKFFCPDKGWILIGQYTSGSNPRLLNQFYYDPKDVVFYAIKTGEKISIDQNGVFDPSSSASTITPKPTVIPQQTSSATTLMSSHISSSTVANNEQNADPCLVSCSECPGGSCRDCNHNGVCDASEESTSTSSPTTTSQPSGEYGLSEAPQMEILPQMVEIPGCDFVSCPTCVGKVCYDCNADKKCDEPQPSP
ncbi:MAG: hypothetical protein LUQ50_14080, partial [Methanospirillum sp.]|uniref:hypothetical protein n=1 Tax=Methanospirillum sp. TaxID=45200 RepID=UPI00237579C2